VGKTVRFTRVSVGIRFTRVDAADVLSITLGHREHRCVDGYAFTAPLRFSHTVSATW
jgi:hypothetical protein